MWHVETCSIQNASSNFPLGFDRWMDLFQPVSVFCLLKKCTQVMIYFSYIAILNTFSETKLDYYSVLETVLMPLCSACIVCCWLCSICLCCLILSRSAVHTHKYTYSCLFPWSVVLHSQLIRLWKSQGTEFRFTLGESLWEISGSFLSQVKLLTIFALSMCLSGVWVALYKVGPLPPQAFQI